MKSALVAVGTAENTTTKEVVVTVAFPEDIFTTVDAEGRSVMFLPPRSARTLASQILKMADEAETETVSDPQNHT